MLFPTIDFAIYFCVVLLVHWLSNPFRTPWKLFMIGASYFFYAWWDWRFVALLAGVSAISQAGALAVHRVREPRARRAVLVASLAAALAPLLWFKYYGFVSLNVDHVVALLGTKELLPLVQVALPVGISFFTFMGVGYVMDVYRDQTAPAGWIDAFLYLSFFPHLVAGPIVRKQELVPQFQSARDPRRVDSSRAAYLIFKGLFKKVVVSSFVASAIVDPVFANPKGHSSQEIWVAVYAYAVQIYADFSGYTDIAIGIALLLGFKFPDNFDRPYSAASLQEFWRRWHMTLSRWLRDYLYIPLGGNRRGRGRTYVNIMLTMLLGGLWHGASWTFFVWGGIHGVGQSVGHLRRERRSATRKHRASDSPYRTAFSRFLTFQVVCFAWVFFRADSLSSAFAILKGGLTRFGPSPLVTWPVVLAIAAVIGAQYVPHEAAAWLQAAFSRRGFVLQGVVLGTALLVISTLGPQGVAPFIYFRF